MTEEYGKKTSSSAPTLLNADFSILAERKEDIILVNRCELHLHVV